MTNPEDLKKLRQIVADDKSPLAKALLAAGYKVDLDSLDNIIAGGEHEHQYTIPVEFELFYSDKVYDMAQRNVRRGVMTPYDIHRVTRLRCACGNEIERKEAAND